MAAGNASRVIRGSGRWVAAPTDLSLTFPFGGVALGLSSAVVAQALGAPLRVESEGLGAGQDVLEPPERYAVGMFLRGWDDDAVERLLAYGASTGPVSGHASFDVPGPVSPGSSALARALVLVYVPNDIVNVPALLIRRGVPFWTEGAEIAFRRQSDLGIPLVVDCFRDDAGRTLTIARMADLVL